MSVNDRSKSNKRNLIEFIKPSWPQAIPPETENGESYSGISMPESFVSLLMWGTRAGSSRMLSPLLAVIDATSSSNQKPKNSKKN
jgi:hypothetical protein